MISSVIFLTILSIATAELTDAQLKHEWYTFKIKHGKQYGSLAEEEVRLGLFLKNKEMIDLHNARYTSGLETYRMAMNRFGDLTEEEFAEQVLSGNQSLGQPSASQSYNLSEPRRLPARVDWYERGAVSPPKDQGWCGSCWSFSVTAALESHHKLRHGRLVRLSEQNLLDCSSNLQFGNNGCGGGWVTNAYQYVVSNGGIDTELSYPYQGSVGPCRFQRSTVGASCRGFVQLPPGNQRALQAALANVGPVSVAMDASRPSFRFYAGGVYSDPFCGRAKNPVNHAVLAIGYDRSLVSGYHWILKNSWGSKWGEGGFFRVLFGMDLCNIATAPIYPLL